MSGPVTNISQTQQQPPSSPPAIFSLRDLRMSQNKSKPSPPSHGLEYTDQFGLPVPWWDSCFELETGCVLWGLFTTVRFDKFVYLKLSWDIYISHLASLKAKGDSDMYPTLWTLNSAPDSLQQEWGEVGERDGFGSWKKVIKEDCMWGGRCTHLYPTLWIPINSRTKNRWLLILAMTCITSCLL